MASYATAPDDYYRYGCNPYAVANIPNRDVVLQAEADAASDVVDSYLRGRYSLPLLTWDTGITMRTIWIATYNVLVVRGYNPDAGADSNILTRYEMAISWFRDVQRQAAHPLVTETNIAAPKYRFPQVMTQPKRGW